MTIFLFQKDTNGTTVQNGLKGDMIRDNEE